MFTVRGILICWELGYFHWLDKADEYKNRSDGIAKYRLVAQNGFKVKGNILFCLQLLGIGTSTKELDTIMGYLSCHSAWNDMFIGSIF